MTDESWFSEHESLESPDSVQWPDSLFVPSLSNHEMNKDYMGRREIISLSYKSIG